MSIPPTGTSITHFETTITKRKSGKKSFYVMARCKKKKWATSETTTFTGGPTLNATLGTEVQADEGAEEVGTSLQLKLR